MSDIPTFSIIVPVYNVEEYLGECFDSLLAQTYSNFEVLAVDDGSTDGSVSILERYAAQDARFRIIRQSNAGPSVARNTGVAAARGEYCLFVDSDDVTHSQLLEICYHLLSKHDADFISHNHETIQPHSGLPECVYNLDSLSYHVSSNPYHLLAQRHRHRISLMTHGTCYRTKLAQKYPFIEGIVYEDYPHTICLLKDVRTVITLQQKLYGYTCRPTSIMNSRFSVKNIDYYRQGLFCIADTYKDRPRTLATIVRIIVPEYLKQMGNAIFRSQASDGDTVDMLLALRALLLDLKAHGLLRWRGHKLRRYMAYCKLMRTEPASLAGIIPQLSRVFH